MTHREPQTEQKMIGRLSPSPADGLTAEEAAMRLAAGLGNRTQNDLAKTGWQIVRDNVFTFFNFVFVALAACLFAVGAYRDMTFLGIIIVNVAIGIVQELRVKHTLNRINLLSGRNATVVRDGQTAKVPVDEVVLDDIVLLGPGCQIYADAVLCEGMLEVNESLLTGEADAVTKKPGDMLLSGSFVVSGTCSARLERVGDDAYAAVITREARQNKGHRSEMMRSLDRLLRIIGVAIVPLFIIMFLKQYLLLHMDLAYAVSATVAAVVGMIPEGLYLLVSVALAVSVIDLARTRTLVHELSCIENLARVDTLCLDKTGTITEGEMEVLALLPASGHTEAELSALFGAFCAASGSNNATARALTTRFSAPPNGVFTPLREIPFSSERKWSALALKNGEEYILGAPEFVLGSDATRYMPQLAQHTEQGRRILVLARGRGILGEKTLLAVPEALGFAVLSDRIRPQAPSTLEYFRRQGVTVKVISGDNAAAVAEVARRAGVENAERCLDLSKMPAGADMRGAAEAHTVFGRVTPQQKRELIRGLKRAGHTVAMIGDGVNDVLALKEADCSIAMAAGSEAAQHAAQLVLLDSNFASMPQIMKEGRRVINNIERSASLFLVKNIFSFLVSMVLLFASMPYPLVPAQISLISALMIGIPSFFLTFEPSYGRVNGGFLRTVLLNALPGGLANVVNLLGALWLGTAMDLSIEQISSVCTLLVGVTDTMVLLFLCWPLTKWRLVIVASMAIGFFGAALLLGPLFGLVPLTAQGWRLFLPFACAAPVMMCVCVFAVSRVKRWLKRPRRRPRAAWLSSLLTHLS